MKDLKSLSHVRWDCKYHVVFVSKYRKRKMYSEIRNKIGSIVSSLCQQKGLELHEGHAMPDHIRLLLSIPPKFSVSNTVRFYKGQEYNQDESDNNAPFEGASSIQARPKNRFPAGYSMAPPSTVTISPVTKSDRSDAR